MRDLLPAQVAVAVADDTAWHGTLLPEEEACLRPRVVDARRREFTAGRVCARRALASLGITEAAVPAGPDRRPVWPTGVVGSITHTVGYCAAAAAASSEMLAIGIDAESHHALDDEVMVLVVTPTERRRLAGLRHLDCVHWSTVVFSAKESVFKACSSLAGLWLEFEDVDIKLDPSRGGFVARVDPRRLVQPVPPVLPGRFAVDATFIRTAIALPALTTQHPDRMTRL